MDNDYYNYIYYFAFENLVKCEDKYEISLDDIEKFRCNIVRAIKEKIDHYSSHRPDAVREKLEDFVVFHEWISEDEQEACLKRFLRENPFYGVKDNKMFLKEQIPYEDIAEKRYMVEDPIERSVISSLFTEASSFESLMALGTTSIFDDVMKIIKAEKCVEETYLEPMEDVQCIKDVGNYFVRSKFIIIASKPSHVINEYYTNMKEFARRYNLDDRIGEQLLSDKTRTTENIYLDNPYIDDELSNIFQSAIFSDSKQYCNSLMYYFDEVWDYVYKDDMEDGLNIGNMDYDDYLPDAEDEIDYRTTQEEVDPDKINLYFYMNYLARLDYYNSNNPSNELSGTRNRLLYALNHYDSDISNNKHFYNKFNELTEELSYCNRDEYKDFYIMSMLFLKDMLDGNIDEFSLKKAIFISCYYDLTQDYRIKKLIDNSVKSGKLMFKAISDAIINHNYEALSKNNIDKIKKKTKE